MMKDKNGKEQRLEINWGITPQGYLRYEDEIMPNYLGNYLWIVGRIFVGPSDSPFEKTSNLLGYKHGFFESIPIEYKDVTEENLQKFLQNLGEFVEANQDKLTPIHQLPYRFKSIQFVSAP
jgi:hypothetical protein